MRTLLLASASPRRAGLLRQIGVPFRQIAAPDVDERVFPGESADTYVQRLAHDKAMTGWQRLAVDEREQAAVLGADTTVVLDDQILGKPADATEAEQMLRRLSGREHRVLTAVSLCYGDGRCLNGGSITRVQFASLTDELIQRYIDSGEPFDKAGGYGIQGFGAVLVASITGSYSGVVGLPLREVALLLQQAGVLIWQPGEQA